MGLESLAMYIYFKYKSFNSSDKAVHKFNMFTGIFDHSFLRAFVRSGTGVEQECLAHTFCSKLPQRYSTDLHCHVESNRAISRLFPHIQNCIKCICMLKN
ncbi:hypothetical protein GOODEAATRI_014970 [Goodea atripinnis]|uniref:Uncharacterized protein n=1 Tax=Goodea atripinnis TaxID=208336 RepID=A0ABV0NKD2_9TELE